MLKLKLQYFGHLMQRIDSLEKTPMLGKIEGERRRGQPRMPDAPDLRRGEAPLRCSYAVAAWRSGSPPLTLGEV